MSSYGVPLIPSSVICVLMVALLGYVLHRIIIAHVLGKAPINQLLATGGVLFFLQSIATLMFGVEFLSLGRQPWQLPADRGYLRVQIPVRGVRRGGSGRGWNVLLPLPLLHGGPRSGRSARTGRS